MSFDKPCRTSCDQQCCKSDSDCCCRCSFCSRPPCMHCSNTTWRLEQQSSNGNALSCTANSIVCSRRGDKAAVTKEGGASKTPPATHMDTWVSSTSEDTNEGYTAPTRGVQWRLGKQGSIPVQIKPVRNSFQSYEETITLYKRSNSINKIKQILIIHISEMLTRNKYDIDRESLEAPKNWGSDISPAGHAVSDGPAQQ